MKIANVKVPLGLDIVPLSAEERAIASSDYDSTYDSTYETNHSDSSDFAQNEEEGEASKKPAEGRDYLAGGIVLHPLLPSPEVGAGPRRSQVGESRGCSFSLLFSGSLCLIFSVLPLLNHR